MAIIDYTRKGSFDDVACGIHRDTNIVDGTPIYYGNGQGCRTIFFRDKEEAEKFIAKYGKIDGLSSGLCEKCSCHYSHGTKEHKRYPEFACNEWADGLKKEVGIA